MAYRTIPTEDEAILFSLNVVWERWPNGIPKVSQATQELGVCRQLPGRLHQRLWQPVLTAIAAHARPGPEVVTDAAAQLQQRIDVLESLLAVVRSIIAAIPLGLLPPTRRQEITLAIVKLHQEQHLSYACICLQLGLEERTVRRFRALLTQGQSLQPRSRAPKQPHGKLPQELRSAIALFVYLNQNEPYMSVLHARFIKEHAQDCQDHGHPKLSYGAFCRASGRTKPAGKAPHTPERGRDAPENLPPNLLALMDTTDIICFGLKFKFIGLMEAHSRRVFGGQLCTHETAENIEAVFKEGQEECGRTLAVRFDRGTPYVAFSTQEAVAEAGVELRLAKAYQPTDKAILERFFLTAKKALQQVFSCIDLRTHPQDADRNRTLAQTIASAILVFYLYCCYPYIPQRHIDGRCPAERAQDCSPLQNDQIQEILDRQARHHEHARTIACKLHEQYGFRQNIKLWLKDVRQFGPEVLLEAQRRFDLILLQQCFTCNSKRNPKYLLAILRTVAEEHKAEQEKQRAEKARQQQEQQALTRVQEQQREFSAWAQRMKTDPILAAERAISLAQVSFESGGFGINIANQWLRDSLRLLARAGPYQFQLSVDRLLLLTPQEQVKSWLCEIVESCRPPPDPDGSLERHLCQTLLDPCPSVQ